MICYLQFLENFLEKFRQTLALWSNGGKVWESLGEECLNLRLSSKILCRELFLYGKLYSSDLGELIGHSEQFKSDKGRAIARKRQCWKVSFCSKIDNKKLISIIGEAVHCAYRVSMNIQSSEFQTLYVQEHFGCIWGVLIFEIWIRFSRCPICLNLISFLLN